MHPALFDTSIYVTQLRLGRADLLGVRRVATNEPLWLSSVVLAELYAGTSGREQRVIEAMERNFARVNRLLVPNLSDWSQTGLVLARFTDNYDYEEVGRAKLFNDTLIAMNARRVGVRVLTANERDFSRLATIRAFQWQLLTES